MPGRIQWLNEKEQRAWKALSRSQATLNALIDREFNERHGLGLADYDILSSLADTASKSQRMTDLARSVLLSPSGLTRRLDALVKAGLVERRPCPSDGRGLLAVLTHSGMAKLEQMEPTHVGTLREHFIDCLEQSQLEQVVRIFEDLAIAGAGGGCGTGLPAALS